MSTRRGDQGQAAVELALCLPLVFLLLLGIVQVALVVREQVLLVHAAREAVRHAAVGDYVSASTDSVGRAAGLDPKRLKIVIHRRKEASDRMEARLSYRASTRVVLVGRFMGEVRLGARAAMRREDRS